LSAASVLPAVPLSRTQSLAALLAALLALSAAILGAVVGTVFFAGTVAYLLIPVVKRVERLGVSRWIASAATATVASAAALVPVALALSVVGGRAAELVDAVEGLPETFPIAAFGYEYTVDVSLALDAAAAAGADIAVDLASALPVLALKLTLFGVLVFGLLVGHRDAERALLATVPPGYHDVARHLGKRARGTLYAIYVLQAATGVATALIAIPVYVGFGVPFAFTLAVASGVLQFVPIVGPSIVVAGVAAYWVGAGMVQSAVAFLVVAGVLVAWLPDVLVRPRLSQQTAGLPGSLYFIGFTGGLLTVGAVGVIAGPLVVALSVEVASMLATERNGGSVQSTLEEADEGADVSDSESAESTGESADDPDAGDSSSDTA
jgi:predicted PurR-regulated permease PerM